MSSHPAECIYPVSVLPASSSNKWNTIFSISYWRNVQFMIFHTDTLHICWYYVRCEWPCLICWESKAEYVEASLPSDSGDSRSPRCWQWPGTEDPWSSWPRDWMTWVQRNIKSSIANLIFFASGQHWEAGVVWGGEDCEGGRSHQCRRCWRFRGSRAEETNYGGQERPSGRRSVPMTQILKLERSCRLHNLLIIKVVPLIYLYLLRKSVNPRRVGWCLQSDISSPQPDK